MTYVVDLIQYAAQIIDVETQKARIQNAVDASKGAVEQMKITASTKIDEAIQGVKAASTTTVEKAVEKAQPVKQLIDEKTADLKEGAERATVAVVASLAHATEIVRRKFGNPAPQVDINEARAQLKKRLSEYIDLSKAYISTLSPAQLNEYADSVRTQSATALASLMTVLNSFQPIGTLTTNLRSWTDSVANRLGYVRIPVIVDDPPAAVDLIDIPAKSSAEPELEKAERSEPESEKEPEKKPAKEPEELEKESEADPVSGKEGESAQSEKSD